MVKKVPKKRAWLKADIADVEEAIEDERLISKMKRKKPDGSAGDDDDLFSVDTKGSFEGISKTSRRELARAKLFPPKGPNIGMTVTEEMKITRAERQVEASRRPVKPPPSEVYDLWGDGPAPAPSKRRPEHKEWRIRTAADHKMINMPGTMHQKVGLAPAVLPAHEGQSMNPHREAYEDLACMAAAAELERERENDELNRKIYPITHELTDAVGKEKLKGMSEEEKMALYHKLHLNQSSGSAGDASGAYLRESARWKQKSQASKGKKKKRRGIDALQDQEKAKRRLEKEVGEVGTFLKGMKDESAFHQSRKEYRLSQRAKRKELEAKEGVVPKKRKLGGGKYAEDAAVVPDPDAGSRGLRATPLIGSAIRERLSSVVRRGLLPPPSENSRETANWHRKKNNKLKRSRKFMSPLLRDNLLLR